MDQDKIETKDLIKSYDEMPISNKRKELGREITELSLVVKKLLNDIEGNVDMSSIEEFDNLYDGTTSEDEYLTGLYEDVINFKELLGMYLDRVTSMYYK